jgi:plastocyanin
MHLRRVSHHLLAISLVAGLAGCGGSENPTDPGGDGGNGDDDDVVTIILSGTSFTPSSRTVSVGTTVRWSNSDGASHTATPDGHSEWAEWSTTSAGQTFEHTFNTAGTYAYYCVPHQALGMTGTITVQ